MLQNVHSYIVPHLREEVNDRCEAARIEPASVERCERCHGGLRVARRQRAVQCPSRLG
jgi:hypothetical protein